jgi:hypothetical protein
VQTGRPETGDFDPICLDLNQRAQNREYRIVWVDHEEILCHSRVHVSGALWPSFLKFVDAALSASDRQVCYEEPRV